MEVKIRYCTIADAPRLLEIYSYYVKKTAITFEYEVPSLEEFTLRIENTLKKYPYLCIEKDGLVVGYAYAGAFKGRAAYDWSVETTIYLARNVQKCGLGRKLYEALEAECRKRGKCFVNTGKNQEQRTRPRRLQRGHTDGQNILPGRFQRIE